MLRERADLELARDFGYCAQSIPFHKMVAAGNDFVVINQDRAMICCRRIWPRSAARSAIGSSAPGRTACC
jgi:hypothetical protein